MANLRARVGLGLGLLGALLPVATGLAADDPVGTLRTTLQSRYPEIKIEAILPSPVPGIYEVFAQDTVIYADQSGEHVFLGQLIDTRTKEDLSAAQLDAHRSINFKALPFELAIKIVKGDGRRQLAVFADPDCPYCQQLEKELRPVTDLTMYVFLFPLADAHPQAMQHAKAIWCAADRSAAWTQWMLSHIPPPADPANAPCPQDPLAQLQSLGKTLRVDSTPTMFLANGRRISGAVAPERILALMETPISADGGGNSAR